MTEDQRLSPGPPERDGFSSDIGARLRMAREQSGMTLREVSSLVRVSKAAWSRYEKGGAVRQGGRGILSNPRALDIFCQRVNVPADVILFGRLPRAVVPPWVHQIIDQHPGRDQSGPQPIRELAAA